MSGARSEQWLIRLGWQDHLKEEALQCAARVAVVEVPEFELWLQCCKCKKESFFYAESEAEAIAAAHDAGWVWDDKLTMHLCPNCLDAYAARNQWLV